VSAVRKGKGRPGRARAPKQEPKPRSGRRVPARQPAQTPHPPASLGPGDEELELEGDGEEAREAALRRAEQLEDAEDDRSSDQPEGTALRLPRVAIVGRPNVGKSTLLNRLCGSRVSIVEPTSGVTRDRVAVPARLRVEIDGEAVERWVEVIDTGGIGIVDRDDLGLLVEGQVRTAVAMAEVILFVVDVREGLTPLDLTVAELLRGVPQTVLLLANKAEAREAAWGADEFRRLGVHDGPYLISAQNGEGLGPVMQRVADLLPPQEGLEAPSKPVMSLAVVGQRNAGKSTLINRLAGEERMIVSEIPGTTRDAVDVRFERDGRVFVAIDTAGLRKRSKMADAIEFYSDARSHKTIRRADVCVLLFDTSRPLSSVDKKLARYAMERYKPLILGANKSDLVRDFKREDFVQYLRDELPNLAFAPIVFLSALEGHGLERLMETAERLCAESARRVSTGALNRVLQEASEAQGPGSSGSRVQIYYATQAEVRPPTFVLFVNDKRLIGRNYVRYLTNRLREGLGFHEVPLHIVLRDKRSPAPMGTSQERA
jgi:GTPase